MSALSPTTQDVVAGNLVSQQPTVVVHDEHGHLAEGVRVTFVDTALVSSFSATTGADGIATTPWFVSGHAGTEHLIAMAQGVSGVVFTANVRADAPRLIAAASDSEQIADPTLVVPLQPKVRVWDQYGNVTAGVTVTFTARGPDSVTTSATAVTGFDGLATYGRWTVGRATGEYTIVANFTGQKSPPATFRARVNKPFPVSLIAAGGSASCAVAVTGGLYCWGAGLLFSSSSTPSAVANAVSFVSLTMGQDHACGLTSDGAAYCWGNNGTGQLGIGSLSADQPQPRAVAGGLSFASLVAGNAFTCGITTDQRLFCWGDNTLGELGNGGTIASLTPSAVATAEHFTTFTAGYGHACGIATTGVTYCWGANNTGQLGGPSTDTCTVPGSDYYGETIVTQVKCSKTPIVVSNVPGPFAAVTAGDGTCGLLAGDQTAYCWGYPSGMPLPPTTFQSLAASAESVCGITTGRQLILCWSYADRYEGATIPPAIISDVTAPTTIVAGFGHWCAISGTTGLASCWGDNEAGQLGNGLHTPSTAALLVAAP